MQTPPDKNTTQNNSTTCPLARDQHGNAIELPPGSAGWRVRRKTGGRPRILLDVQKQPMLVPLHFSIVDLDDVLAPGAYLLDIVDGKGEPLGLTMGVSIGQLRNSDGGDDEEEPSSEEAQSVMPTLPTTGSDTRLVLEANVRSTHLAFQHNQKTLELGLKMAESLREGVQALAEAQADWIKSISSARGFFRNAPAPLLPSPRSTPDDDESDEADEADAVEEDADDRENQKRVTTWIEYVGPIVAIGAQNFATTLVNKVYSFASGVQMPKVAEVLDWRRAAKNSQAAREGNAASEPDSSKALQASDAQSQEAALAADPKARMHFMAIMAALSEQERRHAQTAAAILTPEDRLAWLNQLHRMSVEEGAQAVRDEIARIAQDKPAA